jgi:hypothetical protein
MAPPLAAPLPALPFAVPPLPWCADGSFTHPEAARNSRPVVALARGNQEDLRFITDTNITNHAGPGYGVFVT